MNGQISLWSMEDVNKITPERYVAITASPYWTTSRKTIIDAVLREESIKEVTRVVKKEYSPYGASEHYGSDGEYFGFDLRNSHIKVYKNTADDYVRDYVTLSWEDFAREIAFMVYANEYKEESER